MFFKKLIILFFPILLFSNDNLNLFDRYHDSLCSVLVNTSNSIDDYFIEGNFSKSSRTYAEFSTVIAKETHAKLEKDIRFRLRLNLPKIQKNLRLYFEDESSDDTLYNGTTLDKEKLDSKRYYVRLEFFNYVKDTFNIKFGGGARFRKITLVPYLNIRSKYKLYRDRKITSKIYDRFRYYSDGEIENSLEINSMYSINDKFYMILKNSFYYNKYDSSETLINDFTWTNVFNSKQQVRYGFGVSSKIFNFKHIKSDYYYIQSTYHHLFYKDWIYYEISPSMLKRESNSFKTSYRVLVNFGIHFKSK